MLFTQNYCYSIFTEKSPCKQCSKVELILLTYGETLGIYDLQYSLDSQTQLSVIL